ncbi:uncharacterized protein LOC116118543 [Pistacia vera]|uniref:uncharacterized protein LOC116118543 n=1 Tax=Pistacia vera TaxID=55513 RepID=UPI00126321D9|nr:uncharacterized protein LOC116118543 [Pistacia vera]
MENASAITLRSGRQLEKTHKKPNDEKEVGDEFAISKKEEHEQEILYTFRKVHVNIPLLDAIKQVLHYAKSLKELCTSKRKLRGNEVVSVGENVLAVLQRKLPTKGKDPGSFTIPCIIGNIRFEKAMLDLGASINVMPYSIYLDLNLGTLKSTSVVIKLADRSNAYPKGVMEDVLVQVNELVFPMDFYVLDMKDETTVKTMPLLLGRPFMKTALTKIDVHNGTLTIEFDKEQMFELKGKDPLEVAIWNGLSTEEPQSFNEDVELGEELNETIGMLDELPKKNPRYLLTKKKAKPSLIRWILLLQEFNLTIKDKRGSDNIVVDYLSRLINQEDALPLKDDFPNEQLLAITSSRPWYADIVNYIEAKRTPPNMSCVIKDKLKKIAKQYVWDDPYLWKYCPNQIIRRCLRSVEIKSMKTGKDFKVNGHILKPYYEPFMEQLDEVSLHESIDMDS